VVLSFSVVLISCNASSTIVPGGKSAYVPIGEAISASGYLDTQFTDDDLPGLQDTSITFQNDNYNIHDEIRLSNTNLNVTSSLPASEDDYETGVYLEVGIQALRYYYVFDEAINISKATSSQPLEIKFLGETIKIVDVPSDNKFTAYVDGIAKTYQNGNKYKKDDNVCNDDPADTDCWEWHISGLTTNTATNTDIMSGPVIGIRSTFIINDDTDNPVTVGSCYPFPNNYAEVCMDSLTVDDNTGYTTLTIQYRDGVTLGNDSYQKTIFIGTEDSNALQVEADNLSELSVDKRTDQIWLTYNFNRTPSGISVWYMDTDGTKSFAGAINTPATQSTIARLYWGDTKDNNIEIDLSGRIRIVSDLNLTLDILGKTVRDLAYDKDDLKIQLKHGASEGFAGLGMHAGTIEAGELQWGANDQNTITWRSIGTKNEDHRTMYGIIIRNPLLHSTSDEVVLEIPNEQVMAKIIVRSEGTVPTTTTTTTLPEWVYMGTWTVGCNDYIDIGPYTTDKIKFKMTSGGGPDNHISFYCCGSNGAAWYADGTWYHVSQKSSTLDVGDWMETSNFGEKIITRQYFSVGCNDGEKMTVDVYYSPIATTTTSTTTISTSSTTSSTIPINQTTTTNTLPTTSSTIYSPTTTLPTNQTTTTIFVCDNGCWYNEACIPFGNRVEINSTPSYCDIDKTIKPQKELENPCMNDYECKSNECSDNRCISSYNLLQKIWDFLKGIFGL